MQLFFGGLGLCGTRASLGLVVQLRLIGLDRTGEGRIRLDMNHDC